MKTKKRITSGQKISNQGVDKEKILSYTTGNLLSFQIHRKGDISNEKRSKIHYSHADDGHVHVQHVQNFACLRF